MSASVGDLEGSPADGDGAVPDLLVTCTHGVDGVRVIARGEIDCASAPSFLNGLQNVMADSDGSIVVDLSDVTFIDSSGVSVLVTVQKSANGRLMVGPLHPTVRRVFEMTGLLDVMKLDGHRPSNGPTD